MTSDPTDEPLQLHKVLYRPPNGNDHAASLTLTSQQLVIINTGAAEALQHYPVIRGTPNQRINPDVVDDHKQREGQLYIFTLEEILGWAEHTIITREAIQQVEADYASIPTLSITASDEVHTFEFRLNKLERVQQFIAALETGESSQ